MNPAVLLAFHRLKSPYWMCTLVDNSFKWSFELDHPMLWSMIFSPHIGGLFILLMVTWRAMTASICYGLQISDFAYSSVNNLSWTLSCISETISQSVVHVLVFLLQVPIFNKREEIFDSLFEKEVPVFRAVWYIKVRALVGLSLVKIVLLTWAFESDVTV